MTDASAHGLIVKPIAEWMDQLQRSAETITQKNGGTPPATKLHAYRVDPYAFAEWAEARMALWPHVNGGIPDGLIDLARPFLSPGTAIP